MKKIVLFYTLVMLVSCTFAGTAQAHVLESDGTVGAVLHILPDDNPVSGTPVVYELAFQDTTDRLSLSDCDCSVRVAKDDKTIATQSLRAKTALQSSNTITYPSAGVYELAITGTPLTPKAFDAFSLSFTVRVTSGGVQTQQMPILLWVGLAGMIGLVLLAAYASEIGYTKHK